MNDAAVGLIFFALGVQVVIAIGLSTWAVNKGQNGGVWFILGIIFGPLALLFLATVPNQSRKPVTEQKNYRVYLPEVKKDFTNVTKDSKDDRVDIKRKWSLLKEVDAEVRAASIKVSELNSSLDDELCEKYFVLNSKEYLQAIVDSIIERYIAESEREKNRQIDLSLKYSESALTELHKYEGQLLPGRIDWQYNKPVTDIQPYSGTWAFGKGGILITLGDGSKVIRKGNWDRLFRSGDNTWK